MSMSFNAARGASPAETVHQTMVQFADSYERLVKGLTQMATHQVALTRDLLEGGAADLQLLAQARTPEAFLQAELEAFRRRSARAIEAALTMGDELRQTWTGLSEYAKTVAGGSAAAYATGADAPEASGGVSPTAP